MTSLPIHVPQDFEIIVSKNDTVTIGQVLAKKKQAPSEVIINLSQKLKISPKQVGKYLKKNPGDEVRSGDTLAQKDGLFGDSVVVSNVSGTLSRFERTDGTVTVHLHESVHEAGVGVTEVICPLDGIVTICHNDQIILETDKNVFFGENGTGGSFRGVLKVLDVKDTRPIDAETISVDTIDTVIFGPAFENEAIAKASAIGVGGILTLTLTGSEIEYLREKRLSLPIIQVTEDIGKNIARWKRKEIFMDGKSKAILLLSYEKSTR